MLHVHDFLNMLNSTYDIDISLKGYNVNNINCHTMVGEYKEAFKLQKDDKIEYKGECYLISKISPDLEFTLKNQTIYSKERLSGKIFCGLQLNLRQMNLIIKDNYPNILCIYNTDKNTAKLRLKLHNGTAMIFRRGGFYFCGYKYLDDIKRSIDTILEIIEKSFREEKAFDINSFDVNEFL